MADELPPPPVPAEADLKDFPFTPIYRARLFGSAFHATASDSEWRAGVTLWLKSQDQRPAGSLPDNDIELCRLAELGRDLKTWKRLRAGALHGWYLCSDGRLYHNTVAGTVRDQWGGKTEQRQRTLKGRIAALEKRLSQATEEQAKADMAAQIQRLRQELSQSLSSASTERVTGSVTEPVTEAKREREGKREGKGEGDSNISPPGFAEWYAIFPRKVAKGAALKAYRAALKKTTPEVLLAAAQRFARQCAGKDSQFIKHPATWLNGECWLDETAGASALDGDDQPDEAEREMFAELQE